MHRKLSLKISGASLQMFTVNCFQDVNWQGAPKPWRISLIRELVYGGWLFNRDAVKNKFSVCKDIEYRTLRNLLDNYLPLLLTIYTVTLKLNNFTEYFHGMIRIWTILCVWSDGIITRILWSGWPWSLTEECDIPACTKCCSQTWCYLMSNKWKMHIVS